MELAQFDQLAARVETLLDERRRLKEANEELGRERDSLLVRLEAMESELSALREERDVIRSRVDELLTRLEKGGAA